MMPSTFGSALILATVAKGAVLVALVAAIVAMFRVRSASLRHAFWTSVVFAHLAIPVLTILLPPVRLTMPRWVPAMLTGPDSRSEVMPDEAMAAAMVAPAMAAAWGGVGEAPTPGTATAIATLPPDESPPIAVIPSVPAAPAIPEAPGVAEVTPAAVAVGGGVSGSGAGFGDGVGRGVAAGLIEEPNVHRSRRVEVPVRSMRDALHTVLSWPVPSPLTVLWIVGALVVLARLAAGTARVARLAHTAAPVIEPTWLTLLHQVSRELEISRPITLLRGNRLSVPVTWGVVYPVVLLPEDADTWLPERRRHVLVHELAHVRRLDAFTQLVGQFVLAIFWFDPLVWYAVHRTRVERERACDDVVLRRGAAASRYASDLLDMVRALDVSPIDATPAFATLAMARKHDFENRMLAILDPKPDRRILGARGTAASTAALAMMLVPLSAVRARHAEPVPGEMQQLMASAYPAPDVAFALDAAGLNVMRDSMQGAMEELHRQMDTMQFARDRMMLEHEAAKLQDQLRAMSAQMPTSISLASAAPVAAVAVVNETASAGGCDLASGGSSTSMHSDSDDRFRTLVYTTRSKSRCAHVEVSGDVAFNDEQTEIDRIAPGARIVIQERSSGGVLREFSAMNHGGTTERNYSEDGRPASFDADARAWLSAMIQEMVRESGIDAKRHVARLMRKGGVPAVMGELSRINSTGAKRAYYEALLDTDGLTESDMLNIATNVGKDLGSSASDLSAALGKMRVLHGSPEYYAALDDALGHIESDGDRARTLSSYVAASGNDRDLMLVVLRSARAISSDGDKASVLVQAGPQALAAGDTPLRSQFFRAARSIESDGDLRRVLTSVVPFGHSAPGTALDLIQTARKIQSDGDKAAVLVAIADARLLVSKELQDAFVGAARSISSDGDYRRVMESILRRQ